MLEGMGVVRLLAHFPQTGYRFKNESGVCITGHWGPSSLKTRLLIIIGFKNPQETIFKSWV